MNQQHKDQTAVLDAYRAHQEALFNLVVDPKNWKERIDTVIEVMPGIDGTELATGIKRAVSYFAGGQCTITLYPCKRGEVQRMRVQAPGYYAIIGA